MLFSKGQDRVLRKKFRSRWLKKTPRWGASWNLQHAGFFLMI